MLSVETHAHGAWRINTTTAGTGERPRKLAENWVLRKGILLKRRGVEEDLQCAMRQHVEQWQRAWRWRITATAGTGECPTGGLLQQQEQGNARQIWHPNCKLQMCESLYI